MASLRQACMAHKQTWLSFVLLLISSYYVYIYQAACLPLSHSTITPPLSCSLWQALYAFITLPARAITESNSFGLEGNGLVIVLVWLLVLSQALGMIWQQQSPRWRKRIFIAVIVILGIVLLIIPLITVAKALLYTPSGYPYHSELEGLRTVDCHPSTQNITVGIIHESNTSLNMTPVNVTVKKYGREAVMIGEMLDSEPQIGNITEWKTLRQPNAFVSTNISLTSVNGSHVFETDAWYMIEINFPSFQGVFEGECMSYNSSR